MDQAQKLTMVESDPHDHGHEEPLAEPLPWAQLHEEQHARQPASSSCGMQ